MTRRRAASSFVGNWKSPSATRSGCSAPATPTTSTAARPTASATRGRRSAKSSRSTLRRASEISEETMSERDSWSDHGENILSPDSLVRIKAALEREPLILEHRHYRAASAPDRLIFDDYDAFHDYLRAHARSGDHLLIWGYTSL